MATIFEKAGKEVKVTPEIRHGGIRYSVEVAGIQELICNDDVVRMPASPTGYGLHLSYNVAKVFRPAGGRGTLMITQDIYDEIKAAGATLLATRIEEEQAKTITSWTWTLGGDTHQTLSWPDGEIDTSFRPDLTAIQDMFREWMQSDDALRAVSEIHPDQSCLHGIYNTGPIYRVSHDAVVRIYEERKKACEDAKAAKQREIEERYNAALKTAQKTGKPTILRSWTEDCNDPREECSADNVIEYVFPDGTKKVERYHT